MSRPSPLLISSGSVHHRQAHTFYDDEADADLVDASLPATPVAERHFPGTYHLGESDDDAERAEEESKEGEHVKEEEWVKDEPEPTPLRELDPDEVDERQCRICFGGVDDEDTLGRLISPCLCAGSMRYVHVKCINAWRGTGTNAKAFMECPQCHHQYRLRRTLVSGLATSRPILLLLTTLLFLLLSLSFGQLIHHLLLSSPSVSRAVLSPSPKSPPGTGLYDEYDDWDDGPIIVVGGGGALIYDVVLGAIQTFAGVAQKFASSDTNFVDSLPNPIAIAVFGLVIRFLLGLAVLGSLSFLSLLLSLSLFAPLQIFNGFRGAGLFRRYTRRDGDGTGGTGLGQIMIIIFVLIGAANTLVRVYDGVKGLTRKVLMFVETQILEVNPDERRRAREKERKVEGWWARWVRERRFRSRRGWWEVVVRGWAERRRLVGVVWERMRGEEVGE